MLPPFPSSLGEATPFTGAAWASTRSMALRYSSSVFQVLDDHGHFGVHGFGAGDVVPVQPAQADGNLTSSRQVMPRAA